jgi:hypothetical protein
MCDQSRSETRSPRHKDKEARTKTQKKLMSCLAAGAIAHAASGGVPHARWRHRAPQQQGATRATEMAQQRRRLPSPSSGPGAGSRPQLQRLPQRHPMGPSPSCSGFLGGGSGPSSPSSSGPDGGSHGGGTSVRSGSPAAPLTARSTGA